MKKNQATGNDAQPGLAGEPETEELEEYKKQMNRRYKKKMKALFKKYNIERIGGCHKCQPNADWAEGWGIIPDEVYYMLTEEDSCCSEIDEDGNVIHNLPCFCKFKETKRF